MLRAMHIRIGASALSLKKYKSRVQDGNKKCKQANDKAKDLRGLVSKYQTSLVNLQISF
jgi:hypothetical protein